MATKKSTRRTRSRRNVQSAPPLPGPSTSLGTGPQFQVLRDHMEIQRSRLMDAEAVLDCVLRAMEDDLHDAQGPSYPSLVRIARDFVHSTIDQLDSVNVRAALARSHGEVVVAAETSGVEETPTMYVH
jgi:hypothetical protein